MAGYGDRRENGIEVRCHLGVPDPESRMWSFHVSAKMTTRIASRVVASPRIDRSIMANARSGGVRVVVRLVMRVHLRCPGTHVARSVLNRPHRRARRPCAFRTCRATCRSPHGRRRDRDRTRPRFRLLARRRPGGLVVVGVREECVERDGGLLRDVPRTVLHSCREARWGWPRRRASCAPLDIWSVACDPPASRLAPPQRCRCPFASGRATKGPFRDHRCRAEHSPGDCLRS